MSNEEESSLGTNPDDPDTDGDGVDDDVEDGQGTNPNDPNDHQPPPSGTVAVNVTFGDHSGSHSEIYMVLMEPLEGDTQTRQRSNRRYGVLQTDTVHLPRGSKYKVTITNIGTDEKYRGLPRPDYDYTLEIPQLDATAQTIRIIHDQDGIMGMHDEGDVFFAAGKSAELFIIDVKTETFSTTPANRGRKKLGVKEEAVVRVIPASVDPVSWALIDKLDSTVSPIIGNFVIFTADSLKKSPKLKGTFPTGETIEIPWEIVEPTGETATKINEDTFPAGQQGVGMNLAVTTLPDDVSFYKVEVIEIDKGTSNVTGFFQSVAPSLLVHVPTATWTALTPANIWNDHAAFFGWGSPLTWQTGTYQWDIEVRWRIINDVGQGIAFANRTQLHTLADHTGRSVEQKLGRTATRNP